MIDFKQYNKEKKQWELDPNYLFSYSYMDPFNERLLNADILLDWSYNYQIQLQAFQHEKKTINQSNEWLEKGTLPTELKTKFEAFFLEELSSVKPYYDPETYAATDVSLQTVFVNMGVNSQEIKIEGELSACYFTSEIETQFYQLIEYMKAMVEASYQKWLSPA